jgi:uncharacterized RDD family membrane protein YckC
MPSTTPYHSQEDLLSHSDLQTEVVYAGFWLRFVAFLIDISVLFFILLFANLSDFYSTGNDYDDTVMTIIGFVMIGYVLYFPVMESSAMQATLGKKAVGIKVTTLYGERISFSRALGRFLSRIFSQFLFIGYIMAGLTEKKQALHDIIAGTLVVKN